MTMGILPTLAKAHVWCAFFILCSGLQVQLPAQQATINSCKKLVSGNKWSDHEKTIWHKTCESKVANLKGKGKQDRPNISAEFLTTILSQRCFRDRIGPQGIRISNVTITDKNGILGTLDLRDIHLPWPLWLKNSVVKDLDFTRAKIERDIVLTCTKFKGGLTLANSIIQGHLIMDRIEVNGHARLSGLFTGKSLFMEHSQLSDLDLSSAIIGMDFSPWIDEFGVNNDAPVRTDMITTVIASRLRRSVPRLDQPRSHIGRGLLMQGAIIKGNIILENAEVRGSLHTWDLVKSRKGRLELNRFTYNTIFLPQDCDSPNAVPDSESTWEMIGVKIISWFSQFTLPSVIHESLNDACLDSWISQDESFSFQPYAQLASVMRFLDRPLVADSVLFAGKRNEFSQTLCGGEWCFKQWVLEQFTGYGIGLGSIALFQVIGLFAFSGWWLTWLSSIFSLLILRFFVRSLQLVNKISGIAKDRKELQMTSLLDTVKSYHDGNHDSREALIASWTTELEKNPIFREWSTKKPNLRAQFVMWRVHNAGIGLWNYWVPALIPPNVRPESLRGVAKWTKESRLRPMLLRWYFHVCWILSGIVVLGIIKGFRALLIP